MAIFYSIFIQFYGLAMRFAAFFHKKADAWVKVRKNLLPELREKICSKESYVWIHCASAGEFEQALPLVNRFRKEDPAAKIAVSFFSASGYDMYNASGLADIFFYFPLDTKRNAIELIEILKPTMAIFIRNEIWWNTLQVLHRKKIRAYLVNAPVHRKRNFFYQKYLDRTYPLFTRIFYTSETGNTKLERVIQNREDQFHDAVLSNFCERSVSIFLGSSWKEEEEMLAQFYKKNKSKYPNLKIVIAPHEFEDGKKEELENLFGERIISYTENLDDSCILFLNKKGILKYAYRYADIAVLGGGFGKSVHNVAEAAVYGITVLFGPNYDKFEEIKELANEHLSFPVHNTLEFEKTLTKFLNDESLRIALKKKLEDYFAFSGSASSLIIANILKKNTHQ
jgi:3-deoxy-D-manno-octulosonic-acid transferase